MIASGSYSAEADDAISFVNCPSGYLMTSCQAYSPWSDIDGAKIFGNTCIAYAGADDTRVRTKAICCKFEFNPVSTVLFLEHQL